MAEAVAMNVSKAKQETNRVILAGRISNVRAYDGGVITEITMPAKDEYSRPETVPVSTKKKLGQVGDIIDGLPCYITGFVRTFKMGSGETGRDHKVMFRPVEEQ